MSYGASPPFNISKFNKQLRDTDTDYTIIAFNDLIEHLNKVQEFELSAEIIQNDFLPNVINRLSDKTPAIVNPIFRIIVLLSEKLPIASLPVFFDHIFNFVNDSECQVRNQILSVLREVLSNSVSYPTERQQTIVSFFISKLNESNNLEILVFNIDLLSSLIEYLGFLFNESNLKHAKELIAAHIEDSRLDILPSVASLARMWMTIAVNVLPDQFASMIQELYKLGNSNAFTILSSMVCYKPSIYQKEALNLIALFSERIQIEEENLAQKLEEDPETDVYYDTPYVPHIIEYVSSLTSLVKTFNDECTDEMVDNCISIVFQYLTYGLTQTFDTINEENGNEDEDEDDGFEIDAGEAGEEVDLDDVDDEIITGDDSWKIRKAAMAFAIVLIQCFTDKFYESLSFRDEENDCLGVVNTLIKDGDSGAQKDAFDFLQVVIHYYKDSLQEEDVTQWFSTLNTQLSAKNSQSIASIVISTITYVLNEYKRIPNDLLVKIISSIRPLLNNNTIQTALLFILTIFGVVMPPTSNVISEIALTLTDVITSNSISSTVPYFPATSKLFVYARPIENSISQDRDCIINLSNLVVSIITLCNDENEQSEKKNQAYEVLGDFLSSFDNDILSISNQCLEIIINTLVNDTTMKPMKPICGSISLIAASTNGDNKLGPYADQIRTVLCNVISNDTIHIDNVYLFRYLWTIRILLEKNIIDPSSNDCVKVAPHLAEVFSTSDPRNIILAIKIFMLMQNTALTSLDSIRTALQGKNLNDEIVHECAQLISLCATIDISRVEAFLASLIDNEYNKGMRNESDQITQNVAYVIGFISGQFEAIRENVLQSFEEKIVTQREINIVPFALQCVGEIGALVDLSNRQQLVDSIFMLTKHQNREVFNAAAECLGHLAAGSIKMILPRVLQEAMQVTDNSVWILAMLSMTERLSTHKIDELNFVGNEVETIFNFLINNADYSKPTEKSIAQSFANMIKIMPDKTIPRMIEISQTNDKAGPVASHSISIFFEEVAASSDPYICFKYIEQVMASFNENKPRVSEYIILCLKICLQVQKQLQSQESEDETKGDNILNQIDLFKYKDIMCEATIFNEATHIEKIAVTLQTDLVEVDIGSNLRLNAINCLILIMKMGNELVDIINLFNVALNVVMNDRSDEVKSQAMILLTEMCLNNSNNTDLYELIVKRQVDFQEIEDAVFPTAKPKVEFLEVNFFKLIISIRILTESRRINVIEKIFSKHKADPRIKKFESDLSYSVTEASPFATILSRGSASVSLMKIFYPEASIIFLI